MMNREFTDKDFSSLQKLASVSAENVRNLQQEVRDNPRTIIDEDPPEIEPANPQDDVVRMSAEVVEEQYSIAVKTLDEMSKAVCDRIHRLDHALRECHKDMKLLAEVAQVIRDKKVQIP
jgi:hypothetical protein